MDLRVAGVRELGPARRTSRILGPAFVAAIAYIDPGNIATNLTAAATTGYRLVWVVVLAGLAAILVQFQAAKLGIATGRSLPQLCRDRFPRWGTRLVWSQAEIVVLATDLAEFVGAAIGMRLLFGMPVVASTVVTAAVSLLLLELRRRGRTRGFELMSAAALVLVGTGVTYDILVVGHQSGTGLAEGLLPVLALMSGVPLTGLLIASQVVISLGVPVALFLLIHFCRDRSVMGPVVNGRLTTRVAGVSATVVTALGCCLPFTL